MRDPRKDPETGRRIICQCEVCGKDLYGANAHYEADTIYNFNGEYVCEDCLYDYANEHKVPWNTEDIL
jgi:hypothetical protein